MLFCSKMQGTQFPLIEFSISSLIKGPVQHFSNKIPYGWQITKLVQWTNKKEHKTYQGSLWQRLAECLVHLWEASELKQCRLDKYGEIGNHAWKKNKHKQFIMFVIITHLKLTGQFCIINWIDNLNWKTNVCSRILWLSELSRDKERLQTTTKS